MMWSLWSSCISMCSVILAPGGFERQLNTPSTVLCCNYIKLSNYRSYLLFQRNEYSPQYLVSWRSSAAVLTEKKGEKKKRSELQLRVTEKDSLSHYTGIMSHNMLSQPLLLTLSHCIALSPNNSTNPTSCQQLLFYFLFSMCTLIYSLLIMESQRVLLPIMYHWTLASFSAPIWGL